MNYGNAISEGNAITKEAPCILAGGCSGLTEQAFYDNPTWLDFSIFNNGNEGIKRICHNQVAGWHIRPWWELTPEAQRHVLNVLKKHQNTPEGQLMCDSILYAMKAPGYEKLRPPYEQNEVGDFAYEDDRRDAGYVSAFYNLERDMDIREAEARGRASAALNNAGQNITYQNTSYVGQNVDSRTR